MWKKLLLAVMVIGVMPLTVMATAQDDQRLIVWFALSPEDSNAMADAVERFVAQTGVAVNLEYIQPALLYESVARAQQSGSAGPDVIIADNRLMESLVSANLIAPGRDGRTFFLADLLEDLPALVEDRCDEDTPVASCLWPQTSPTLPIPELNENTMERTADFLCEASPWLPFCRGGNLTAAPVSWWYNVYLVDASWTAQNGMEIPSSGQEVLEFRSEFGLSFLEAESGNVPLAQDTNSPPIYLVTSMLMVEDPNGVMRSLASFAEVGYVAVLDLRVDAAYVTTAAADPDMAHAFVDFLRQDVALQSDLTRSSQRLPAFDADVLRDRRDTPAADAIFEALVTLVAYANQAYY